MAFDTVTTLPKEPSPAQSADLEEGIARTFAALVMQLRHLGVAGADRAAVNDWLAGWDSYVAYGHTYAAALRSGTDGQLVRSDAAAQGQLRRRLQAFAVANHMPVCKFQ